jgi:hypothetical protein
MIEDRRWQRRPLYTSGISPHDPEILDLMQDLSAVEGDAAAGRRSRVAHACFGMGGHNNIES